MKNVFNVIIMFVTVAFFSTSCLSDGGGFSEGDEDTVLAEGLSALESIQPSDAEGTYCDAYDGGSANSQIAFGCFLSKLVLLPETSEATSILDSLNEDAIDVEDDILTGVLEDLADSGHYSWGHFEYADYSQLPLSDILSETGSFSERMAMIANRLIDTGTTVSEFRDQIFDLVTHFEDMEPMLETVLADTDFSYTIPAELFSSDEDVEITHNTARFFMAGVKGSIVTLNIFAAYDYGVTLEDVVDGSDSFDLEILVEDLNGSGSKVGSVTVDTTKFLTLEDASLIQDQRERFIESVEYLRDGFEELLATEDDVEFDDDYFGVENYEDMITFLEEVKESAEKAGMVELTSNPDVSLDLYAFFKNPPSAEDVTSADPFIYNEDDDKIEGVETFFAKMFEDVVSY